MMLACALIGMGLSACGDTLIDASTPEAAAHNRWQLTDVEGNVHEPFADENTPAFVMIFISVDCPIANSYHPQLQRLARQHASNNIPVFFVHPNRNVTIEQARTHAGNYNIRNPVIVDRHLTITRRVDARVMPEAFVFVRDRRQPVYRGRIDNRYAGYGKKRAVATTHELASALDAVAAGRLPSTPRTKAIGCFISTAD